MVLVYVVLLTFFFHLAQGQVDCLVCQDYSGMNYNPDPCYNNLMGTNQTCTSPSTCRLEIVSEEGSIQQISRACGNSGETVAHGLQCTTSSPYFFSSVERTTCTSVCSTNGCNNQPASSLKICALDCSGNGKCVEGICVCDHGYNGTDCSNEVLVDCYVCQNNSGLIDSNPNPCYNNPTGMIRTCRRPSTCRLEIVAEHGFIQQIRRGCGNSGETEAHALQCTTSRSYHPYYSSDERTTCTSVCSTDGCNRQPASNLTDCAFGCSGNGKCVEGICVCNDGFNGTDCSNKDQVDCYACHDYSGLNHHYGPNSCYNNPKGMIRACTRPATCRLEIVTRKGSVLEISRSCGNSDETVAHALQCTAAFFYIPDTWVEGITCTSVCNTNGCNSQPASNLTDCAFGCSGNGKCVEGICVCNDGFTGSDCRNEIPVNCYVCQSYDGLNDSNPYPCYNNPTDTIQDFCWHSTCVRACTRPATCRLEIVTGQGSFQQIRRGCGYRDETVAHKLQCTTSSYYSSDGTTTCTAVCSTDGCNNQPASNLTDCAFGCSGNGKCIEGICVCNHGYNGTDCSNEVTVNCYVCQDYNGLNDSNPNPCYNNPVGMIQACPWPLTCRLEFEAKKGSIQQISRACGNWGETDTHDLQCTTRYTYVYSSVERTTCTAVCNTDSCNNQPTTSILSCVQCDDDGYSSSSCSATLTPELCWDTSFDRCLASQTTSYDTRGAVVRSSVSRRCSRSSSVIKDECTPSTSVGYSLSSFQYTCTQTCSDKGCNTFTPQEPKLGPLYCCTDQSCTAIIRCLTNQRYCYFKAMYSTSASQTDVNTNGGVSDERGCSATVLTSQCTNTKSNGSKVTTCQETCQTNGCNNGWPNRPKCLQCTSQAGGIASGSDECLYNPQSASSCPHPSHQFCVYIEQGKSGMLTYRLADNRRGYPRSMSRSCSTTDIGTGCADVKIGDTIYQQCNKTCSSDGCNYGMGGSSRPVTSLVVLFATSVMAYVTLFTFSQ